MKICVAQTKTYTGNVEKNIKNHVELVNLAVTKDADCIFFPELSLTGYEPKLADKLATDLNDERLDIFQTLSNNHKITIGVGMPLQSSRGITISMLLFQPNQRRQAYSKKYLHPDEVEYFVAGSNSPDLLDGNSDIALAICYEISVEAHAELAFKNNSNIYVASVAKFNGNIDDAIERLGKIATDYSMIVLMANCVGISDGNRCVGKSSVWNRKGSLLDQLDESNEGILVIDTETENTNLTTL